MLIKKEAAKLLLDICGQLNEIHSKGRVHLNICQENIQREDLSGKIYYRLLVPLELYKEGEEIKIQEELWLWHNNMYSPECRRQYLDRRQHIIAKANSDVYSFMVAYFQIVTGQRIPNNFQLNKKWKKILADTTEDWNPEEQQAIMNLFYLCTKIDEYSRIQNAGELIKHEAFKIIKNMT